jgi:hypothetical protein
MADQPNWHRREEDDPRLPLTATDKVKRADGGNDDGPPMRGSVSSAEQSNEDEE